MEDMAAPYLGPLNIRTQQAPTSEEHRKLTRQWLQNRSRRNIKVYYVR